MLARILAYGAHEYGYVMLPAFLSGFDNGVLVVVVVVVVVLDEIVGGGEVSDVFEDETGFFEHFARRAGREGLEEL